MNGWTQHHSSSERAASEAELARRSGHIERAAALYREAANAEERALREVPREKARTLGITVVSAASLWFMAGDFARAQQVAYEALATGGLPAFAALQLRDLLQTVWGEEMRARSGISFLPGDVVVSVSGGDVVYGAAPLDLILRKVEEIRAVVVRTIEMKLGLALRRGRPPSGELHDAFEPWLVQQPAGSYQFAVRVRKPAQEEMFGENSPAVEEVTSTTLDILRASVENPAEELPRIVEDKEYRETFLKLARNLAPTGKSFGTLRLTSGNGAAAPVVMLPAAREAINRSIREISPRPRPAEGETSTQVRGILRGLSLNKDWLEIRVPGDEATEDIQIFDAGETLDDVIGPMVNRRVVVDAYIKKGGTRLHLRDIQPDE